MFKKREDKYFQLHIKTYSLISESLSPDNTDLGQCDREKT